ncbi:exo-alpha-sialidase [Tunicatimonas pelagia]|uniref:exo-alpha-sialidase n=1 Tax=Tunicatimonas pelagia TaxID=931531 RepID=UPI0026663970|nr:exo-alpha-sialidase [Tunicatimonas pelagia]WKN40773.1 exo-alpha-sialidase [Tunicatimonas pelagia]
MIRCSFYVLFLIVVFLSSCQRSFSLKTIAQGEDWFVNWADFPSMAVTDSFAVAHYLQKSAEGTYDYDIKISLADSQQTDWSTPAVLHQDGVAAEHGFVTLLPLSSTQILSVWLDGRQTKQENGAMNLYTNIITPDGTAQAGYYLDNRICGCCQTDAALTSDSAIMVYRNRTDDEIRDIYVVRQTAKGWSAPYPLHDDGWQIAGCPVNGPAISVYKNYVAVVWFTAANDIPKVQVIFSGDGGKTFGKPIQIDQQPPLGRVDIEMINETTAVVSWMESSSDKAGIKLIAVNSSGALGQSVTLTEVGVARSSGFPIIAQANNRLFCAYTRPTDSITNVQTAWILTEELLVSSDL